MQALPERVAALIDARTFPTLATVNANGSPQTTVHWATRDGDAVLMSTVRGRRHARNLERDPRVSVLVMDSTDPYSYAEIRGVATLTEQGGRELIDDLNEKYHGVRPYPKDGPDVVRLVIRIEAERIVVRA